MTVKSCFVLSFISVGIANSAPQVVAMRGPASVLTFDPLSRSVRLIVGIPGAAFLGIPVAQNVERAVISPNGHYILTFNGGAGHILTSNGDSAAVTLPDDVCLSTADLITWA